MGLHIPHWLENAVDDAGGAFKAAPGVIMDLARVASPIHNVVEAKKTIEDMGHAGAALQGSPFGQGFTLARAGVAGLREGVDPAIEGYQWVRDVAISHPLAAAFRAAQEGPLDPFLGPFRRKPGTIDELWKATNDVSPGQQAVAPFGALENDVSYKEAIGNPNQFADQKWFSFSSGVTDAVLSFTADPLVVGGKTASLARTATVIRPVTNVEKAVSGSRIAKWHDFVMENQGKADVIGENAAVKRSAARDQIAWAYAHAGDRRTAEMITRSAMLDKRILDRDPVTGELRGQLVDERADLAVSIARANSNVDHLMQFAYNRAENPQHVFASMSPLEQGALANMKKEIQAMEERDTALGLAEDYLQGSFMRSSPGAPLQNWMTARRYKWSRIQTVQRSWFNQPVHVIRSLQDRRLGVVRFHEMDAGRHAEEHLKRLPGVTDEEHARLVGQAMGITTEGQFDAVMTNLDRFTFKKIGQENNLSADHVEHLYQSYARSRQQLIDSIQSRKFVSIEDPRNPGQTIDVWVNPHDPTEMVHAPLLEADLRNAHVLVDPDEVRRVVRNHNGLIKKTLGVDANTGRVREAADWVNSVWKASVLLRFGYTLRVLGDDQMRIFAKFGAMTQLNALGKGAVNFLRNQEVRTKELARRIKTPGETPYQKGTPLLNRDSTAAFRIGDEDRIKIEGVMSPGPFADSDEYRALLSSYEGWNGIIRRDEGGFLSEMRRENGKWVSVSYDPAGTAAEKAHHAQVWMEAINDRLANSLVARKLMAGESHDDVVKWLKSKAPEAKQLKKRLGLWTHDPEDYVGRIGMYVDGYVPRELRAKALDHAVTTKDLAAITEKPIVHGEQLSYEMGSNAAAALIEKTMHGAMRYLGSLPSDVLSRQVVFDAAYKGYMRDGIKSLKSQGFDFVGVAGEKQLQALARTARRQALKDLRGLLFDMASKSQWANAVRLIAPFAGPWQDTLAVWLRLGIENPHNIARLLMAFDVPARAGILTDPEGRPIESTGIKVPGDVWISFPIPFGLDKELEKYTGMNRVGMNEKSLNLVLQGDPWWLPGSGPMVAVPVNELLQHVRPEVEDYTKFILPFGAQRGGNALDRAAAVALPATFKRMLRQSESGSGPEDASATINVLRGEWARYLNGDRKDKPTMKEIFDKAKHLKMLQTFAQFVQPGQTQFENPAKFYVDEYRRLRDQLGPDEAQKQFLNKYGPDFWIFMTSVSKNNTGIQATVNAVKASRKYSGPIKKYPELGGLIIGPEGDGPFSSAAYNYQLNASPGPGLDPYRERVSPQESFKRGAIDAGWREYQKYMSLLDSQLYARGLRTYYQQGAEDLLTAKKVLTSYLANKYVDAEGNKVWYSDLLTSDPTKKPQRMEALRAISQIPELKNNPTRTDIKWLGYYFQIRDNFERTLQQRAQFGGSATLNAQSNLDLFQAWSGFKQWAASRDTKFADLYHRYLEFDNLEWDPNISTLPDQEVTPSGNP